MLRLLALAAALGLGGCLFNDCSFDTESLEGFRVVQADARSVGDTLTLAFVDTYEPSLEAFVRAGLDRNPTPTEDGTVRLSLDTEARVFAGSAPLHLAAQAVGDTVYLYVAGRFEPSLVAEVCSPPQTRLRLDVLSIEAPRAVRAIRTVHLDPESLAPAAARALRQREAYRPTPV